ncbi:UNVERIFIED_CONTAM: hypothetical protein Sradi_3161800 [Sesamum radiatum]|uniref:Reverse transcriptase domain-containing protein n=1 Tax=Sesamum radiatum TaxID=300843 RepID=A0AAW2RFD1_SESRA
MTAKVSTKMNEVLIQPFTTEEVKCAIFRCTLISLCNITYKIASKVLANRLNPILSIVISESQSAFLPGRLITDNVLVAYELNHYLAHKTWGSIGHVALKLDLSKACDLVEWSFLESVLT